MSNIADAYAMWLTTAWLAIEGRSETPPIATLDAAHYLQAIMVSVTLEAALSNPTYLEQVKTAAQQGAVASGIDLEACDLTDTGFVLKQ